MFGKIGNIADRLVNTFESFKNSNFTRTPNFRTGEFNNANGQTTAINNLAVQFAQGQQTKPAVHRQPNEWEQKALNKLDQLAKDNDGYVWTSETTEGLRKAKAEIKQIIAAQKPGQSDRGVSIATFAILNVGNGRFKNDAAVEVVDSRGQRLKSAPGEYKCNIFVAAAHVEGGHLNFKDKTIKGSGFPLVGGAAPVTNWLGDKRDVQKLSNLKIVTDGSLRPGDIVAWRNSNPSQPGHSAIYVGGGIAVYSGSGNQYGGLVVGGAPKLMTLKELDGNLHPSLIGQGLGLEKHEPFVVRRYSEK